MFKAINSSLVRASVLISTFFALNKLLGLGRQYLIVKQFGLGAEIDAFNVSNNIPDLIFSVFSGGALAMAFIPVFAQYLETQGEDTSWRLFSKVASFMFLATALLAVVIAVLAP